MNLLPSRTSISRRTRNSAVTDLARVVTALFRDGKLLSQQSVDAMLVTVSATDERRYGLGVGVRREAATGRPETMQSLWGHSGHWGSFMFYAPALRATITGTVNRAAADNRWIFSKVVELLDPVLNP